MFTHCVRVMSHTTNALQCHSLICVLISDFLCILDVIRCMCVCTCVDAVGIIPMFEKMLTSSSGFRIFFSLSGTTNPCTSLMSDFTYLRVCGCMCGCARARTVGIEESAFGSQKTTSNSRSPYACTCASYALVRVRLRVHLRSFSVQNFKLN